MLIIVAAVLIAVDAGVVYFLVPRMMGSSQYWTPPTIQECFKHSAIANGAFLILSIVGFGWSRIWWAYWLYIFKCKFYLNWLALFTCAIVMAIIEGVILKILLG